MKEGDVVSINLDGACYGLCHKCDSFVIAFLDEDEKVVGRSSCCDDGQMTDVEVIRNFTDEEWEELWEPDE